MNNKYLVSTKLISVYWRVCVYYRIFSTFEIFFLNLYNNFFGKDSGLTLILHLSSRHPDCVESQCSTSGASAIVVYPTLLQAHTASVGTHVLKPERVRVPRILQVLGFPPLSLTMFIWSLSLEGTSSIYSALFWLVVTRGPCIIERKEGSRKLCER